MSYKSLLFCPDEKTARVVTQVLSELEFTVELSGEPFAAVKKLTDEHFDALVVDCQNEQDASLLFKAARNSSLNHSSLSVAVVEGQAGVAKAFRIGANLVLSKPVNVEQSKSTLRVARGLLRKNSEARAAASGGAAAVQSPGASSASSSPSTPMSPAMLPSRPFAFEPSASSGASPSPAGMTIATAPSAPPAPYSALELEKEPTPAAEPGDAAFLESMGDPARDKPSPAADPTWAPRSQGTPQPIAASTGGAAAAPAMARTLEPRLTGLSPMVTNDPIVVASDATEHFPVDSIPTFATLDSKRPALSSSGRGKGWGKTIAAVFILGTAGYLAWQNIQPLQYLPGSPSVQRVKPPVAAPVANSSPAPAAQSISDTDKSAPDAATSDANPAAGVSGTTDAASSKVSATTTPATTTAVSTTATPGVSARSTLETIRVQEMPMNSEQKKSLAAKPQSIVIQPTMVQPIVVQQNGEQAKSSHVQMSKSATQQPAPPPTIVANNSDAALTNLVSTAAARPALGSFRVSQGVSQGLVIKKVAPVYSPTALQLHKEGAVDLMVTISKDGSVTSLQVIKGDLLLAKSAVDAVKQWKYRPYLLNGEPVEIQTQITVNFKMPQ